MQRLCHYAIICNLYHTCDKITLGGSIEKKYLALADLHVPFHDTKLLNAVLKFIDDLKEVTIVLLGDVIDFYSISRFQKEQSRANDLQYEADSAAYVLKQIRHAARNNEIIYIMGNHEERLKKFLSGSNTQALRNLRSLQFNELLNLEEYNIRVVPYSYKISKFYMFKHGESCGKYPSRGELNKEMCNGMSGHAHKTDRADSPCIDFKYTWRSIGMMGDKKQLDQHYSQALRWDRSIALIRELKDYTDVEVIDILKKGFFSQYLQKFYTL